MRGFFTTDLLALAALIGALWLFTNVHEQPNDEIWGIVAAVVIAVLAVVAFLHPRQRP